MNRQLKFELDNEMLRRMSSSPVGFLIAIAYFSVNALSKNTFVIETLCLSTVIFLISLWRIQLAYKYKKKNYSDKDIFNSYWLTIINGLFFSGLVFLFFYQNGFDSKSAIIGFSFIIAFVTASVNNLAANFALQTFFNLSLTLPIILYMIFVTHTSVQSEPLFWLLLGLMAYSAKQGKDNRIAMIQKIKSEISLHQANLDLKESQIELVNQTAKSFHSSRMAGLGEMAAGVAHEINNPLAIIQGNVERLQKLVKDPKTSEERINKMTETVLFAVKRIEKIVKGMRSLARQNDLDPSLEVNLMNLIQDTLDICSERMKNNGVLIQVTCPTDLFVECRETQISQILINLLNNAFDALSSNETIDQKIISINCEQSGSDICIRVSNSGQPIPEEARERLFQPFFTTKEIGKGTGLGLSISKSIAQQHGGDLVFEPHQKLTTFCIKLPKSEKKNSETSEVA